MYFDNYLNPKPSPYNFNYPNPSTIQYNQPNFQTTQPPSQNFKTIYQPRLSENTQNFNLQFTKNQTNQTGNYRPFINQQTGTINNPVIEQKGPQKSVNPSFLNTQSSNLTQNQQKKEPIKRRDSNSTSNYFLQNQIPSPSFHASFIQQNKNPIKTNFTQQSHHNVHSMGRPTLSTNNLNNFDLNSLKDPHRSTIIEIHPHKDFHHQKISDKSLTHQNMNSNQLKFDHSKHSPKPYALGFRSKNETFEFETMKNKTNVGYEDKSKKSEIEKKDLTYNFQLKNTSSDWNMFSKTSQQGGQSKFYTPSNIKKQSLNEQANTEIKNDSNKVDEKKQSRTLYHKDINQTEREFSKSPSIDTLLTNAYYREAQYKKIEKGEIQKSDNSFQGNKNKQNLPQQRVGSQSYFGDKGDKKPSIGKNYQALIQNLQKKFSEQKKSSDSFEAREKSYQNQISKKDEKIKRLQSIIENNKQTIVSLQQTINHFKKSNQLTNYSKANAQYLTTIQQLKQQNESLKEQLNQQRRKSSTSFTNLNNSQDKNQNLQIKIKSLEKSLSQTSKQIENKQAQINSLRQQYSTLHQSYKNQFKQHQNTRQQLKKIKQNYQELIKNVQIKTQKIQQLNTQLVYLQSKYEGSLEKLLTQNQHFQNQKSTFQHNLKTLKIQKQTVLLSQEKLKSKVQQLQNQLTFKSIQIETLQEKVTSFSEQENTSKQRFYENDFQQISQQLQKKQQELKLKQQSIEQLSSELKRKTQIIQQIVCQKTQLMSKIQTFQIKFQKLENEGIGKRQIKSEQRSKKTSDSIQMKENIQNSQFNDEKQNLLELYHEKYSQIVHIFNLLERNQETGIQSMKQMPQQNLCQHILQKPSPSKEYLNQYHHLITDQIKKIFRDLKKLVLALKQCQTESQLKNQRLYQLDKTLKKQGNKIGSLFTQIHMKNVAIAEINKVQLEKQIFKLNEKYQILNQITY